MIGLVIGFSLFAAATTTAPPAQARSVCEPASQRPSVSVRVKPGSVKVSNSRNRATLRRLQSKGATLRQSKGWEPVGLTTTELGFSMKVRINALPRKDGRYCGYLDTVNASVGYDSLVVYIARKYRPGSCQYASIMDHEKLHVMIFRRTLERYAPRIERRLTTAALRLRPLVTRDAQQAATQIKNKLRREIQPLFQEMNRELDRSNASLDTEENYRREQARCPSW